MMSDHLFHLILLLCKRLHKHYFKENQEFDGATKGSIESLKFKDRSYEMIYCPPQTEREVQFAQNRTLDDRMYQDTPKRSSRLVKQYSLTSADKKVVFVSNFSNFTVNELLRRP